MYSRSGSITVLGFEHRPVGLWKSCFATSTGWSESWPGSGRLEPAQPLFSDHLPFSLDLCPQVQTEMTH